MSILLDPLQAAVGRALEFDPDTRERIRELDGWVVGIELAGIGQSLCVTIAGESVLFSRSPEREPDLRLTGTPSAFLRYLAAPDRVEITESGIKIEGDIGLAQRFVGVLRQLDIDWEEWASRYLGDVVAYRAGRFAEVFRDQVGRSGRQFQHDVTEYLQEEIRLLAPRRDVERLMHGIDIVRSDVERLAERIKRLRNIL